MEDAHTAQQAGAFGIVLECIPSEIAEEITNTLAIPTIGIGAGVNCDGQVLVTNDLLGLSLGHVPRFVKQHANLKQVIADAAAAYRDEVRDSSFPDSEHSYS